MHGDGKAVRGRGEPASMAVRGLALGYADAYAGRHETMAVGSY